MNDSSKDSWGGGSMQQQPETRRVPRNRTATGSGGHRSFVARRFLEEEEGDDLEPGTLNLDDDSEAPGARGSNGSVATSSINTGVQQNLFERRDFDRVDQSVNLMDTSAANYGNRNKRKHARGRGLQKGGIHTSMVDVFLDYTTAAESNSRTGDLSRSRKAKCRDLFSGTRFLILICLIIVGSLIAVFAAGSNGDSSSTHAAGTAPTAKDRTGLLQSKLLEKGVTNESDFKDANSPAFKALKWLSDDDEAQLRADDPQLLQRHILSTLYFTWQPANWKKSDYWLTDKDVCQWYGIDCETIAGTAQVVHLNLTSNQLQGTIPSELKGLTYLVELDLSSNSISGAIPGDMGEMTWLNYLMLNDNKLTGSLPSSMNKMQELEELVLSNNQLQGELPFEMGHLMKLRGLKLDHNSFAGPLPKEWKQQGIHTLHIQGNAFTGRMPHSLFQLTTLMDFRVGNNRLTGTIPPEIESIFRLEIFEAQMNQLHGEIPEVFDRLHHLHEFNVHHNKLESRLPTTMGKCTTIQRLLLDSNSLTGTIPDSWGNLINLETLVLHNNQISGTMPSEICDLKLEILEASCKRDMTCECCTACY